MKNSIYYIFIASLSWIFAGCTDMLMEEHQTRITSEYVYNSPEGLDRGVVALYDRDRNLVRISGEGEAFVTMLCDGATDIVMYRGGTAAALNRLSSSFTETSIPVGDFWENRYGVIGKANEIIHGAEVNVGLDHSDERVKRAWAEAKLLRARCYFDLYKRFENVYLNTRPTHIGNLERIYKPASKEKVFELILSDLDDAMSVLDWTATMPGRGSKAIAKHVKAQAAMWLQDWDTAIKECEDIFEAQAYEMMPNSIDCFTGADLNHQEVLMAYQFSGNTGGGNTVSSGRVAGHRLALNVTPSYSKLEGFVVTAEYGGYGWGRFYPNTYLLGLYDRNRDTRYQNMFMRDLRYNTTVPGNPSIVVGQLPVVSKNDYLEKYHVASLKNMDKWTNIDDPARTTSYKDVVVYRLAETYLMAGEARLMKYGGSDAKAIEYYNKTWERAGNTPFTGPLTIEMIVDEHARELHFEGKRWDFLKRLGILESRVRRYSGDTVTEDPMLPKNEIDARNNMAEKFTRWPIPSSALDQMGRDNFPQNEDW